MTENKGINDKIKDLENADNWKELIKKQQELFRMIFGMIEQIQADLIVNGIGDYNELYRADAHNSLKESIQEEGRGLSNNKGGNARSSKR